MPEHYGFWSLVPPLAAIGLAIKTRQVFVSLLFGVWLGWIVLLDGAFLEGTVATVEALVNVFDSPGNTRTIIFSCLVGALIAFIQRSGGAEGFVRKVNAYLETLEKKKEGRGRVAVQLLAFATGAVIFVESSINALTVGTVYRPVFDRLKIPREKLAYIADSISAPTCILVPLNAWGAYIMGLLLAQGFDRPFLALAGAFPFNFYPMLAMGMVLFIVLSGRDFGPMKKAELRARNEGKLLRDGATPMISSDVASLKKKDKIPARAVNMIVPLGVMAGLMPVMLAATGWSALENPETRSFFGNAIMAIGQGSGSASVLYSVLIAVVVAMILYKSQRLFTFSELMDLTFKGVGGLIPLAALMMLAFAIGAVCRDLGTGVYVAEVTKSWLSPNLAPLVVFVVSCFIAFSTGTSWGTFAIMIAIGVPMAETLGASMSMTIAAALGGGVFGDHCSPISDTTIISSMASASDLIDHVKTQLPYALVAGGAAALLYFVLGFVIH